MRVVIVGAGIVGLYLAWKLSEKSEQVIVFEKKNKIGKEVCSGLFSERVLNFIPETKKLIENQIDYSLIHFPGKTLKIIFSKKFFVIDHAKLDRLVAILAEKAGAKIILKKEVEALDIDHLENFERIIGCDGANSVVRKKLGLSEPDYFLGIRGFVKNKNNSNFVETWPTQNGFFWKIPRGKEVEYGIIEKPKQAKKFFDVFLKKHNLCLERENSALIPRGLILSKNKKITLCGDACGLTKPWSGGGVIWGLIAADLLLKNFPDFLKYKKEAKKFFLPKIIFSQITREIIYFLGFKFPLILPKKYKIDGDFLI